MISLERGLCSFTRKGKKYAVKLIVHADTFMDSAIEFYADKKQKKRNEQRPFNQKT